jgi:hypothetical protein
MSDDSSNDDGGGGGGGGFFGWFWNAVVSLFGGGNSGDADTSNPDNTDGDTTTPAGAPPATTTGDPPEGDAGTPVAVAPPNVSTTEAGADENPSNILPPGHDIGVWYQKIDGEWVRTDLTDERDLGLGEFAKDNGDGVTSLHGAGGPSQNGPDDPKMTGYKDSWKQGPNDVEGIPGGTPDPNTWVYLYGSVADLPGFLQPSDPEETAWQVPSTDGGPSYEVFVQANGEVIVWRTGK